MSVSNGPGRHGFVLLGASQGSSSLERPRILYILSLVGAPLSLISLVFYPLFLASVSFVKVFVPGHVTSWSRPPPL